MLIKHLITSVLLSKGEVGVRTTEAMFGTSTWSTSAMILVHFANKRGNLVRKYVHFSAGTCRVFYKLNVKVKFIVCDSFNELNDNYVKT